VDPDLDPEIWFHFNIMKVYELTTVEILLLRGMYCNRENHYGNSRYDISIHG